MAGPVIELEAVGKRYGTHAALDGVSLAVGAGEFVALVGGSGSGKTTLLKTINGLVAPDVGQVRVAGEDLTAAEPHRLRRRIGYVFQEVGLFPHMSVAENIAVTPSLLGWDKARAAARVETLLQLVDLPPAVAVRAPAELSGGQRQRVALARALVRQPQVFLMDEPLSNLDAQLRAHTRVEIKRLHQQIETTIIYVTHDQIEAMTMGDRIAVMKDGRIAQLDSPKEIYEMPADLFVAGFIGSPSMNFLKGTLVDLGPAGATVRFENQSITLPLADVGAIAPLSGKQVVLGIRPESLILKHQWRDERVMEIMTEVEVVEPSGSRTFLHLRCEGQPMIAEVDTIATPALKPGSQLPLYVNLAHLHLFDAQTEKNVLATSRAPLAPRT